MYRVNRVRSLRQVVRRIWPGFSLESAILDLLASRDSIEVLEIGFGYGRVLLELAWLFHEKNVKFHGVDKAQNVESREGLREIAAEFDIVPQKQLAKFDLPEIHFYDATSLHFESESLDLVYSAFVIRFIERKAEFLEEICRVLRPGGRAILHIGGLNWNYPHTRVTDERILTPYTNRFVLRHVEELIPLPVYLKLFEGEAFRFAFPDWPHCTLCVWKLASGRLSLDLDYNKELSMRGRELPLRNQKGKVTGGFRSVYDVRPQHYRALFQKKLLKRI